tara:strand:- start:49 stop:651 length:603 start_codon:yes stop_codon:yes gene_type:complete
VTLDNLLAFRSGTQSDATSLALILDAAGRRIPSNFWSLYAAQGQSFFEFGREGIRTNVDAKSYCENWKIAESKGVLIGAFFGFLVEDPYPAINYEDELNWWIPFLELERIAAGSWLLQAISILPEHRGQGHANSVMAKAEEVAKENCATKITLQVEEINQIAVKTYTSNGYSELGRRKLIPFPFSEDTGDIILMEKNLYP